MSQHINICWDFFLSILFEFPSCSNLSKLSNSFSITKTLTCQFLFLFKNLCFFASGNSGSVARFKQKTILKKTDMSVS